jgi:hypothetical protein
MCLETASPVFVQSQLIDRHAILSKRARPRGETFARRQKFGYNDNRNPSNMRKQ